MTGNAPSLSEYQYRVYLLGEFCLSFAVTEMLLHHTVQELAAVNTNVFQAIFSGLRAEGAMQNINRLLEAAGAVEATQEAYRDIFTHLKFLLDARNLVLHYGVTMDHVKREIISTNVRVALSPSRERTLPFSAEILQQLIDDTKKANAHLGVELMTSQRELVIAAQRELLQQPWRYIPPPVVQERPQKRTDLDRKRGKAPKDQT